MHVHFLLRLLVMSVLALLGWELGELIAQLTPSSQVLIAKGYYRPIAASIAGILGFVIAPFLTIRPYRRLRRLLSEVPPRKLIMGVAGLVLGSFVAVLLALPLSLLPGVLGEILPSIAAVALAILGATILVVRDRDILSVLGLFVSRDMILRKRNVVLLDTSVIIDGRIADICQTGFISGTMLVPRFVLEELQHIADSSDVLRRKRGRRGLEILSKLQKDTDVPLEIFKRDAPEIDQVDGKLIKLAQELDCPVLTNDYNLNRVAELQGVTILNINELANAIKLVVLPGEMIQVQIMQEGKEAGQGVGYLDDGTMVVVEDGKRFMNTTCDVVVTRVLQTVAGRMIFAQIRHGK